MSKLTFLLATVTLIITSQASARFSYNNILNEKKREILKGYTVMNRLLTPYSQWSPFICDKKLKDPEDKVPYLVTFSLREKDKSFLGLKTAQRKGVVNFYKVTVLNKSFIDCGNNRKNNPKNAKEFMAFANPGRDRKSFISVAKIPETQPNDSGILQQARSADLTDKYYFADILYGQFHVKISVTQNQWKEGHPMQAYATVLPNQILGEIKKRQLRRRIGRHIRIPLTDFEFDDNKLFKKGSGKYETELTFETAKENERAEGLLKSVIDYYKPSKKRFLLYDEPPFYNVKNSSDEFSYFTPASRRMVYSLFDAFPESEFFKTTIKPKAKEIVEEYLTAVHKEEWTNFKKKNQFKLLLREKSLRDNLDYYMLLNDKKVNGAIAIYYYNDTDWFEDKQNNETGPWFYNEDRECWYAVAALIDKIDNDKKLLSPVRYEVVEHKCDQ